MSSRGHCFFDGLGNRNAQTAGAIGVGRQNVSSGLRLHARARHDGSAPGLHHDLAIGLLLIADLDHVDLALDTVHLAGKAQRAAPLAGAGLGGQAGHALFHVVVGLGNGGVGLVAAGRADAFIFVVDLGRRVQCRFPAASPIER